MKEIASRSDPYEESDLTPQGALNKWLVIYALFIGIQ